MPALLNVFALLSLLCVIYSVLGMIGMVKVAVLARPYLATTGSTGCSRRLGAARPTREERPSTSDPSGRT